MIITLFSTVKVRNSIHID